MDPDSSMCFSTARANSAAASPASFLLQMMFKGLIRILQFHKRSKYWGMKLNGVKRSMLLNSMLPPITEAYWQKKIKRRKYKDQIKKAINSINWQR